MRAALKKANLPTLQCRMAWIPFHIMSTIQRDLQDQLSEGARLRKLGIDQEELDSQVREDITEVVSQRAWFDSNGCDASFHGFRRVNGRMEAFHSDDQVCGVSEYFLPLNLGG